MVWWGCGGRTWPLAVGEERKWAPPLPRGSSLHPEASFKGGGLGRAGGPDPPP